MPGAMCKRHRGAQPGGGICAICLQEKLIQLWRGEGNSHWDTEEYSVTPPRVQETCDTPSLREPSLGPGDSPHRIHKISTPCFPLGFRARNLHRDDVRESSKSSKGLEREKIDRSCTLGLDGDDGERDHQFSCEIKPILKEIGALHEKKRSGKGTKKQLRSENLSPMVQRQQQDEAVDVSQDPVSYTSGIKEAPADAERRNAEPRCTYEDADDDDQNKKATLCFNFVLPGHCRAKLNLKWAKVLASPIRSSNRIAPSKSDLLLKTMHLRPKIAVKEAREDTRQNYETSGPVLLVTADVSGRTRSPVHQIQASPQAAPLPLPYVQCAEDEDGSAAPEIDKETAKRMEASRIIVMAWLHSLPPPKTAQFKVENHHKGASGLSDDLSLGNSVLEMCDEEEVEFDTSIRDSEFESPDFFNQISSFGKFLLSSPRHRALTPFC